MRLKFLSILGALIFTMTETANAAGTLILETSKGEIRIALLETLAPNHVSRIKTLAKEGFYDGIIFHRVIPGFMAQTGDPTGTGMGGSGQNLKAEFSDYQYQYGTVGMARAMSLTAPIASFSSALTAAATSQANTRFGVKSKAGWKPWKRSTRASRPQNLIKSSPPRLKNKTESYLESLTFHSAAGLVLRLKFLYPKTTSASHISPKA